MNSDTFIVSAVRTPIGSFMGSLSTVGPIDLGTHIGKAAVERAGIDAGDIDTSVWANVVTTGPRDLYTPRAVALQVGAPNSSTALAVNRLCGSGVQAYMSAAQQMAFGDGELALVGGAETMSQAPFSIDGMRKGRRLGDGRITDWLPAALSDPMGNGHMGVTAHNVAKQRGISRERQDEFSLESHRRARAAIEEGHFKDQIVPVTVKTRKGEFVFDTDEHPRETSMEQLAKLPPAFEKDSPVTAGNASGMNDAAGASIVATEAAVKKYNLTPLARIVSWSVAGVDPAIMGCGPIEAVPRALKKAGLTLDDIDLIESNEAFAAQAIAVADELGFDPAKTNIDGGAVALGHPIGATGVILTVKLISSLKATGGRYGLVTACIGGGQGIAMIVEVQ